MRVPVCTVPQSECVRHPRRLGLGALLRTLLGADQDDDTIATRKQFKGIVNELEPDFEEREKTLSKFVEDVRKQDVSTPTQIDLKDHSLGCLYSVRYWGRDSCWSTLLQSTVLSYFQVQTTSLFPFGRTSGRLQ